MTGTEHGRDEDTPGAWRAVERHGAGPFVTWVTYRRPDGLLVRWESRVHRKHHNHLDRRRGTTWWAPDAVGWWIGVLFMLGSVCFAIGAVPGYVDAVGVITDNVTFFVGSIFFTSAAVLQYLEVVNTDPPGSPRPRGSVRFFAWEPHRIDWSASVVQLAGTVFFNVSTFAALEVSLGATGANRHVWRPNAFGSICFLVASQLAFAEVGHRWISWRPHLRSWWIAALNLGGSIAFGVSAVAAYVGPDSGEPRNVELVNLGTFVGAIGFFVGAFLLLPERTDPVDSDPVRLIPST